MPDPTMSDDALDHLTRAYLHRRRGRPAPPDLEAKAISFALSGRHARSLTAFLTSPILVGVTTLILASAVLTGALLLHHSSPIGPTGSPPVQKSPSPTQSATSSPTYPYFTASPTPTFLPPVGPACTSSELKMRIGGQGGVGGDAITQLVFTDVGTSPCVLDGTPHVELSDTQGHQLGSPQVVDSTGGVTAPIPNHGVGLRPMSEGASGTPPVEGQAVLPLQYINGCFSTVSSIQVTFAGGSFTLPIKISPDGTQAGGACGIVYVNPFQPPTQV